MSQTQAATTSSNKKPILFIVIGLVVLGAGMGGTWYVMKDKQGEADIEQVSKTEPAIFIKLDTFTVNLQSEDDERHFLQIELTIKASKTDTVDMVKEKMPEIRNQILLLLSSKRAGEISSLEGKQQLSQDIADAIKLKIDQEVLQNDIKEVLFTSFIIQ